MEPITNISPRSSVTDRADSSGFAGANAGHQSPSEREQLSPSFLYSKRIIAFDSDSSMAHAYDVLRNQLQNGKKDQDVQVIAITAPTRGCGTTVTAVNLALSFARVPGANVLLVDANAREPAVGSILGLPKEPPFADPVKGWLTTIDIRGVRAHLLRTVWGPGRIPLAAELARMLAQVEHARQTLKPTVVLLDLPPMLSSDEAIPFVDGADTLVLVLAVGESKLSDLEICRSYLGSDKRLQVVLNKTKRHGL